MYNESEEHFNLDEQEQEKEPKDIYTETIPIDETDVDWNNTEKSKGWEPIKYLKLRIEQIMTDDVQETYEEAKTRAGKRIQSMYANGKSGISFNFKSGTERHQVAVDRLTHLIQYSAYLKENGMGDELCSDVFITSTLQTSGDYARFKKLDNIKKWQYRFDVYSYKSRIPTILENECKISKTGNIHIERIILEVNGGYHNKWKQMMKDEWRDIDSLQIFPAARIVRFNVDELVPENLNPNNDYSSIDFDVVRKIITGRNYFSKSTTDLDMIGRPVGRNMLMPKNYFS